MIHLHHEDVLDGERVHFVWTTPRTWVTSEVVTSTIMNTHVRDNLAYLHGDAGTTVLASRLDSPLLVDTSDGGAMRVQRHPYGNPRHIETGLFQQLGAVQGTRYSSAVTFTNAFVAPVIVVVASYNLTDPSGVNTPGPMPSYAWVSAVTTTGFTIWAYNASNSNPSDIVSYWLAEGPDV